MVSTGVATRRSGSLAATPMVLVPRSRPSSAPRSGSSAAASMSVITGIGWVSRLLPWWPFRGCGARILVFPSRRRCHAIPSQPILAPIGHVMQITWYGHSAFRLDFAGHAVLIDPFFTGNPAFVSDKAAAIKGVSPYRPSPRPQRSCRRYARHRQGRTTPPHRQLRPWHVARFQGPGELDPMNARHHPTSAG